MPAVANRVVPGKIPWASQGLIVQQNPDGEKTQREKQHGVSGCSAACHREGPLTRLSQAGRLGEGGVCAIWDRGSPAERPSRGRPKRGMAPSPMHKMQALQPPFFLEAALLDGPLASSFP